MTQTQNEMIAVGAMPIHPGMVDYADAKGKVILWVRDEEEGRSVYMTIEMYGETSRAYEVRYDDFAKTVTKVVGDVVMHDAADPYNALLMGEE